MEVKKVQGKKVAIKHMELPDIVVCADCRDAVQAASGHGEPNE
jgi:hypothetical protein